MFLLERCFAEWFQRKWLKSTFSVQKSVEQPSPEISCQIWSLHISKFYIILQCIPLFQRTWNGNTWTRAHRQLWLWVRRKSCWHFVMDGLPAVDDWWSLYLNQMTPKNPSFFFKPPCCCLISDTECCIIFTEQISAAAFHQLKMCRSPLPVNNCQVSKHVAGW